MAGTHISITVEDQALLSALGSLLAAGSNIAPALGDIGGYLRLSHDQRFDRQASPEGSPWAALSGATLARKTKNKDKLLIEEGNLRNSLNYNVNGNTLEFGSNSDYAATHQFGRDAIPARPFLGLDADDEAEVLNILREHLLGAVE